MKFEIIDRRKNPKDKSLVNRQRFLKRHGRAMKEAVREQILESDIKDVASDRPKKVKITTRGTEQPVFRHDEGGVKERVLPGNKEYMPGDKLPRPESGAGSGARGAPDGEGEDTFVFEISQEEFLHYFFEDLKLPDLVKKSVAGEVAFRVHRAGFSTDGTPSNLDPLRTMRQACARRIAFRMPKARRKRELEAERDRLRAQGEGRPQKTERLARIESEIETLERQIRSIPFLDDMDIRYRRHERMSVPISQAVMFCILDVSGSMGEWEKEMAKRFFMLLYLFLTRHYKHVDIVFIRHHHEAMEVDEQEFFRARESGGTVVSSALRLMKEIVAERYPTSRWNIYGCQASDGDNYMEDLPVAFDLLAEEVMPLVQYFAYIEVDRQMDSQLWPVYLKAGELYPNFAMARIADAGDIYPVFRGLFEPRGERAPNA